MEKTKLLIDTDIGGDIDDALALSLALNSPELELVGITTVYLANEWRFNLTKNMLHIYNRDDIPVSRGAEKPLCGWWDENKIPDSGKTFQTTFGGEPLACAADFIVSECEKDDKLVLVPIGPLTNIGAAIAKAPHIAHNRRIVLMGGMITKAHPEWNILCDPEAARIVFESGAEIEMIGLDVTNRCTFTHEDIAFIKQANNPRAALLGEMLDKFLKEFPFLPVLHDPLTVASIIWPDLVTLCDKRILIETAGVYSRGVTIDCDWEQGVTAKVAVDVNAEEFKKQLLERIIL